MSVPGLIKVLKMSLPQTSTLRPHGKLKSPCYIEVEDYMKAFTSGSPGIDNVVAADFDLEHSPVGHLGVGVISAADFDVEPPW
jgi:hypothetical protein